MPVCPLSYANCLDKTGYYFHQVYCRLGDGVWQTQFLISQEAIVNRWGTIKILHVELICSTTELGDTVGKRKQGRGSLSWEIGWQSQDILRENMIYSRVRISKENSNLHQWSQFLIKQKSGMTFKMVWRELEKIEQKHLRDGSACGKCHTEYNGPLHLGGRIFTGDSLGIFS